MAEYRSKHYAFKTSITKQNITIKDALKIQMLDYLRLVFKTYLIIINKQMRKDAKLGQE